MVLEHQILNQENPGFNRMLTFHILGVFVQSRLLQYTQLYKYLVICIDGYLCTSSLPTVTAAKLHAGFPEISRWSLTEQFPKE